MRVDIIKPSELDESLVAQWNALRATDPNLANPYFSTGWAKAVGNIRPKDSRVAIIEDSGKIIGFLPYRKGLMTAMPLGAPMSDYQAMIAAPGTEICPKPLLNAMNVGRFDFTHFVCDQTQFSKHFKGQSISHIVDLTEGLDTYMRFKTKLGSKVFKRTAKKIRRAEREVGPVRLTSTSNDQDAFDKMVRWKQAQYIATGTVDIFKHNWTLDLMRACFERDDPDFKGVLTTLHIGDDLAAVLFSLVSGRVLHGWFVAYDINFSDHSPGQLLFACLIEDMENTPFRILDFGSGDYRFKHEFCNLERAVAHGTISGGGISGMTRNVFYGARQWAENQNNERLARLPGKAMRRLDTYRGLY